MEWRPDVHRDASTFRILTWIPAFAGMTRGCVKRKTGRDARGTYTGKMAVVLFEVLFGVVVIF